MIIRELKAIFAPPKISFSLGIKLLFLPIFVVLLGVNGCDPEISPPSGDYTGSVEVTIDAPNSTAIYYTLDGSEPETSCLEYTGPFTISETAVVKAVSYTDDTKSAVFTQSYNIAGSGDSTVYTNEAMLEAWIDYETLTRQVFADKYFGGCEPIVGCGGGGLDLGELGLYLICEDDPSITDKNACEAIGSGWITWDVIQEGLGGMSIFIYNDYTQTLSDSSELTVSGMIVGHFDSNGSGTTGTLGEGETLQLTGAFVGSIEDSVVVTDSAKTGGSYVSHCLAIGCAEDNVSYLVSPGPTLTLVPPAAASCAADPFYHIQQGSLCISLPQTIGWPVEYAACDFADPAQQWVILKDVSSPEQDDYRIKQKDGVLCISALPIDPAQPDARVLASVECYEPDRYIANQSFTFGKEAQASGTTMTTIKTHTDVYTMPYCMGPLAWFNVYGMGWDCDNTPSIDLAHQLLLGTDLPPSIVDPAVDRLGPVPEASNFDFSLAFGGYHDYLDFTDKTITMHVTPIDGSKVSWTAQGLGRGSNGFTYLMGSGEKLLFEFSESVDIGSINLNSYGDAKVVLTHSDASTTTVDPVDAKEGGFVTDLNITDVVSVKVKANKNYVIVKGFSGVVPHN